mmetsp:Transcript_17440/g.44274  ORF Transcript_17440/g.44274 Transcript_17440/m.44274 type:complete len:316 (+) Transcript_17440:86-1033(+)
MAGSGAAWPDGLLDSARIEALILSGFVLGSFLLLVHGLCGRSFTQAGGRAAKVCVELQRKSFHMIGGCLVCATYHWGVKRGALTPAFPPCGAIGGGGRRGAAGGEEALDAGMCFLACSLVSWILEASRLMIPSVQRWYLGSFRGLVREKELQKAAGIAYFLPGALVAMLAAPKDVAVLGILFLSMGDAAASLGTAAGRIPVGASSRKVEGSIGCFVVCFAIAAYTGLPVGVAGIASSLVTLGELLAEVIGLDDNFVIPILGVLGVRLGLCPQIFSLMAVMGSTLGIGVLLGALVGSTTASVEARGAAKLKGDHSS